jgi:2,3-bisphosphoglycerate-dependent phosphoglycerate mutase
LLTIYFEPHALSLDNEAGIASGHNDVELSESGRRMAAEIKAPRVAGLGIDAVYTSDLKRAYDTAAIIFAGTNVPINKDWRLRECDYGEMTRNPRTKVFAMREDFISNPFPGGESYVHVLARMKKFLEHLKEEHEGETIFVIGHSATYISLEHLINGVPIQDSIRSSYDTIQFPVRYVLDDE